MYLSHYLYVRSTKCCTVLNLEMYSINLLSSKTFLFSCFSIPECINQIATLLRPLFITRLISLRWMLIWSGSFLVPSCGWVTLMSWELSPPPLNIIPTPKSLYYFVRWLFCDVCCRENLAMKYKVRYTILKWSRRVAEEETITAKGRFVRKRWWWFQIMTLVTPSAVIHPNDSTKLNMNCKSWTLWQIIRHKSMTNW